MASYFYAINPTESLVTLARLVTTYFIFINLSILLFKQDVKKIFNIISIFVSFILLYDAIYVISGFSKNMETVSLDQNIFSLMGNHGNKNVMAASLLIKFPFVLWVILNNKVIGKVLGLISLFLGIFALFILNTRSTFVGLLLIFSIYTITTIFYKYKSDKKGMLFQIGYFLIPIIFAYFSANLILANAVEMQGFQGGYGTVSKRVGDINVASEENSRIHLWKAAADYAAKHPLLGAGYGNWKLASIPYEKERATDLFVPYHSHNDFIEMFADLGLIGGLSFAYGERKTQKNLN
jgi:O-antigen ligase